MNTNAVIGAGFGDEGKGLVVDYLCQKLKYPLVVRYCGGQQAGHQVVVDNDHCHVFSNFGSGTLHGAPTYWMPQCTIDPIGIVNECAILLKKGIEPELYIDGKCPVTTPYEVIVNQKQENKLDHGSCKLGINATYRREENHYSLLFEDLFYPSVVKIKLHLIAKYYNMPEVDEDSFLLACNILQNHKYVKIAPDNLNKQRNGKSFKSIVFEGSQGLLLDQNFGFFPHVTPSNTGLVNISNFYPLPWVVTRAYHTRHGNGPMTTENMPHNIKVNPWEENHDNSAQGTFKIGLLDLDLMKYGISKDEFLRSYGFNLVITCLDLIDNEYRFIDNGVIKYCYDENAFVKLILDSLGKQFKVHKLFVSHSPISSQLKEKI